jgi:hypothetical protein
VLEQEQLRNYSAALNERQGFNDWDAWEATSTWEKMSETQRAATDLDGFFYINSETKEPTNETDPKAEALLWKAFITRGKMDLMAAQQRISKSNASTSPASGAAMTPSQYFDATLLASPYFNTKPGAASTKAEVDRWNRVRLAYDAELVRAFEEKGGRLSEKEERKALAEVLEHEVFVRESWATDQQRFLAELTDEQVKDAYIPIPENLHIQFERGGEAYNFITWATNIYKSHHKDFEGETAPKKELEEAYFYWITQDKDTAIRRLRGDSDL